MNRNLIIAGAALIALYTMNRNQSKAVSASTTSAGGGFSANGGGSSGLTAPAIGATNKKPVQDVEVPPTVPIARTVPNETGGEFEFPREYGGIIRGETKKVLV
jgi:hypothetical protein